MTNATLAPLGQVAIGPRAARTLVAELARHTGPKTGLLVTVGPDSPVLAAAIDALLPEDSSRWSPWNRRPCRRT